MSGCPMKIELTPEEAEAARQQGRELARQVYKRTQERIRAEAEKVVEEPLSEEEKVERAWRKAYRSVQFAACAELLKKLEDKQDDDNVVAFPQEESAAF